MGSKAVLVTLVEIKSGSRVQFISFSDVVTTGTILSTLHDQTDDGGVGEMHGVNIEADGKNGPCHHGQVPLDNIIKVCE